MTPTHISIRMNDQRRANLDAVAKIGNVTGDSATIDFALGYVLLAAFCCPECGERREDDLLWVDENLWDDVVECRDCGTHYKPEGADRHGHHNERLDR